MTFVHAFRLGNMKLDDFRGFIEDRWPRIEKQSVRHRLVEVYRNRIEQRDSRKASSGCIPEAELALDPFEAA